VVLFRRVKDERPIVTLHLLFHTFQLKPNYFKGKIIPVTDPGKP
jgi:hypothetical protein